MRDMTGEAASPGKLVIVVIRFSVAPYLLGGSTDKIDMDFLALTRTHSSLLLCGGIVCILSLLYTE